MVQAIVSPALVRETWDKWARRIEESSPGQEQLRLQDIVSLATHPSTDSSELGRARQLIYRLEKRGVGTSEKADNVQGPRYYSVDDTIRILTAAELVSAYEGLTPARAARLINETLGEKMPPSPAADPLSAELDRLNLVVSSRLMGVVVGALLDRERQDALDEPAAGSFVALRAMPESLFSGSDDDLVRGPLAEDSWRPLAALGAQNFYAGFVDTLGHVTHVVRPALASLEGREFFSWGLKGKDDFRYELVVGLPREEANWRRLWDYGRLNRSNGWRYMNRAQKRRRSHLFTIPEPTALEAMGRALDIVAFGFEGVAAVTRPSPHPNPPVGIGRAVPLDVQLQWFTHLVTWAFGEGFCNVLEVSDPNGRLKVVASSRSNPDQPPPRVDELAPTQMLSGYVSTVNVPLALATVQPPFSDLVSNLSSELPYVRTGSSSDVKVAAIPAPGSTGMPVGALYLASPQYDSPGEAKEEAFSPAQFMVLKLLAGIAGELLERRAASRHDVKASLWMLSHPLVPRSDLRDRLTTFLVQMHDKQLLSSSAPRSAEDRIAFVLVSVQTPGAGSDQQPQADSLARSARNLHVAEFLHAHLGPLAERFDWDEIAAGLLDNGAVLIALPRFLTKGQLNTLRSHLPTKINRIEPKNELTSTGPPKFLAWILDIPASEVQPSEVQRIPDEADIGLQESGDPDYSEGVFEKKAAEIITWAGKAQRVLNHLVKSFQLAQEEGKWRAALEECRRGLRLDPGNGYLHRTAAECLLSLGNWGLALYHANQALANSENDGEAALQPPISEASGSIRSMCLAGEALLAQGEPDEAFGKFNQAFQRDPQHPLPHYYKGQAYLRIAQLLRLCQNEACAGNNGELEGIDVERLSAHISGLTEQSREWLNIAGEQLRQWGEYNCSTSEYGFQQMPALLSLGAGALLAGNADTAVDELSALREKYPRDRVVYNDLLVALCWQKKLHHVYGRLFSQCERLPEWSRDPS